MFGWAMFFAALAVIAGAFGFPDLSGAPGASTRTAVLALSGLCVACLALELMRGDR
jgi:uncharacterized membrane protein YtjA (UPF0391 family)